MHSYGWICFTFEHKLILCTMCGLREYIGRKATLSNVWIEIFDADTKSSANLHNKFICDVIIAYSCICIMYVYVPVHRKLIRV